MYKIYNYNIYMSENEQLLNNIKYDDVLDMLGLTLLIYDYGK